MIFTCGCCGAGFSSTREEQTRHDQDEGFGICTSCEEWMQEKTDAELDELAKNIETKLSPQNAARFQKMSPGIRRGFAWRCIQKGHVTWTIGGAA